MSKHGDRLMNMRKNDAARMCDFRSLISKRQKKKGFFYCDKRKKPVFITDCQQCVKDDNASFVNRRKLDEAMAETKITRKNTEKDKTGKEK